jgi:hypothetical protein
MRELNRGMKKRKNKGYICNFQLTAKSKQSTIKRKFAPSAHPGRLLRSCFTVLRFFPNSKFLNAKISNVILPNFEQKSNFQKVICSNNQISELIIVRISCFRNVKLLNIFKPVGLLFLVTILPLGAYLG